MKAKYKTQFPESYISGRVSQSITLSREADELIREKEIDNTSAFLNDLVIGSLRTSAYWTKKALADFEEAKERLIKQGFAVAVEVKKVVN